jgi:KipI family sensor histidine kinase inhibitor
MMHCTPLGDHSLLIDFSESKNPLKEVHGLSKLLFANKPVWAEEIAPGLDTLVIQLNYTNQTPAQVREQAIYALEKINTQLQKQRNSKSVANQIHQIQICYHLDLGLDLNEIAKACGLSAQETINLHKKNIYTADILGFMPGFAYFSGLHPKLRLPRLSSPRPRVPKGSVAIAELQTAIYPRPTPGGWNLIGRSPDILFDARQEPPGLFMPGDQMQIQEISLDQFYKLDAHNQLTENILPLSVQKKNQASIEIKQSGTFTTIQDQPRSGLLHWAVGPGGASDLYSLELANALVGNALHTAALEITATGPSLLFSEDTCVAWVGATCTGIVNGKRVPGNRPVWIAKGSTLQFSQLNPGLRCVLAIGGGMNLPTILGSKGSHISADIGPKRLQKGDILFLENPMSPLQSPYLRDLYQINGLPCYPKWQVRSPFLPSQTVTSIRCLPGPHLRFLASKDREMFWSTIWKVSNQSNRMGIRLEGNFQIKRALPNIPSQAITFGTVQFPPSQEPIVMLSEHQTTGGYPRLAEVIKSDQAKLAQVKPGNQIQLIAIDLANADRLNLESKQLQESTISSIELLLQTGIKRA